MDVIWENDIDCEVLGMPGKEKDEDLIKIGLRIQNCRLKAGLTQEKLAEKVNISQKHLSRIEQGYHNPHFDIIIKIARALDVPTDAFSEGDGCESMQKTKDAVLYEMKKMSRNQLMLLKDAAAAIKKYEF